MKENNDNYPEGQKANVLGHLLTQIKEIRDYAFDSMGWSQRARYFAAEMLEKPAIDISTPLNLNNFEKVIIEDLTKEIMANMKVIEGLDEGNFTVAVSKYINMKNTEEGIDVKNSVKSDEVVINSKTESKGIYFNINTGSENNKNEYLGKVIKTISTLDVSMDNLDLQNSSAQVENASILSVAKQAFKSKKLPSFLNRVILGQEKEGNSIY